jgi:hypothetical protein
VKIILFLKKIIKGIKNSYFLKDFFIISMIFIGIILGAVFFYYTKSKIVYDGFVGASLVGAGYDYSFVGDEFYKNSMFILSFCLLNIILAKLIYTYDMLASYILVASIPVLNTIYLFNTILLFSFS